MVVARIAFNRRTFLQSTGLATLGTSLSSTRSANAKDLIVGDKRWAIPKVSRDRVIRTVVGLRPLLRTGFRVETERFDAKAVIHNYGHGFRGVGMSWGTSHLAVEEAVKLGQKSFAVIGCGAVGLATGRLLQRRGFSVTIYAKDLPPNTTSNVAGAYFDPDVVPEDFGAFRDRYVRAARISHRHFQDMVGDYYGVRWQECYDRETAESRNENKRDLLGDLYHRKVLTPDRHPFGEFNVVRSITMQIQTPIYLRSVMRDFRLAGGRIIVRDFSKLDDVLALPEPVVMNCSGLGARSLFGDEELTPVKGQLTVLLPQRDVDYRGFSMFPRDDGLLLSHPANRNEFDVWSLEPNKELIEETVNRTAEFWNQFA